MADIVTMPKLGFDMAEGTLVRWVVAEGQQISKGNVLAEIETDKATVEVESTFAGLVTLHLVKEGDIVPVNAPIAVIGAQGETVDLKKLLGASAPEAATGMKPAANQEIMETPLPATPPQVDELVPVVAGLPAGVRVSPLARRLAQERGLDLRKLKGSGPQGRIVRKDIEAFAQAVTQAGSTAVAPAQPAPVAVAAQPAASSRPAPIPIPSYAAAGAALPDERIPLNKLRQAIGRRMAEAKAQFPHFYVTHEYDLGPVMAMRKQINALLPDDEKVSVNDFIVKATALALRQFPNLNASLDGDAVIRHGAVNVGVAVSVEGGLLTIVCRDADRKPLRQISSEVRSLAARARAGKVRPDDIQGSTFSISNLGMFDVENFIAIINPPEAAILAVGSAREVPAVVAGEIRPAWRMKATISVDHRVSDGAEAARFLQALAPYLEEPLRLMI